jgi:ABC-type polysaccharide/polyol phosphate export permease
MNLKLKKAAGYNIWDYFAAMVTAGCLMVVANDVLIIIRKLASAE